MRADRAARVEVSFPLEPPRSPSADPRGFVFTFVIGLIIALMPLIAFTARVAALGEIDLFDTDGRLASETLHGPLAESFAEYKLQRTRALRPEVLLFGTSRTVQWRGTFFDNCNGGGRCFYNASGAMDTVQVADIFLHRVLETYTPRVLLLDIAPFNFDPKFSLNDHRPLDLTPSFLDRVRRAAVTEQELVRTAWSDADLRSALLGRVTPSPPGHRGVRAIMRAEGFRPDGSYDYGPALHAYDDSDAVGRVHTQGERFEWFSHADDAALAELEDLLSLATANGITVIAFETPFSDAVVDAVAGEPGLREGWADVDGRVEQALKGRGIPFLRFRNTSAIGCLPGETLDGFHPGEVCSARLLERLLDDSRARGALADYVHAQELEALITTRYSALLLDKP